MGRPYASRNLEPTPASILSVVRTRPRFVPGRGSGRAPWFAVSLAERGCEAPSWRGAESKPVSSTADTLRAGPQAQPAERGAEPAKLREARARGPRRRSLRRRRG